MVKSVQAHKTAQNPGLLVPSGSGSADFADLSTEPGSQPFVQFVKDAMNRELLEECGLTHITGCHVRSILIGFARLLNRGGKPEFFGVSFLDVPFDKLTISSKEFEYVADIRDIQVETTESSGLAEALRRFRESHQKSFSLQLHLNLLFLQDYLEDSWTEFQSLFATA